MSVVALVIAPLLVQDDVDKTSKAIETKTKIENVKAAIEVSEVAK
jgi:hypothetical protein